MMTLLLWRHLTIEHSQSVYYFLHQFTIVTRTLNSKGKCGQTLGCSHTGGHHKAKNWGRPDTVWTVDTNGLMPLERRIEIIMLDERDCEINLRSCLMFVVSAGDVHPHQLRASATGAWCCDWTRDWDDWEEGCWRRSGRLVGWLGSAWTDPVDTWHHAVTTPGSNCDDLQALPL